MPRWFVRTLGALLGARLLWNAAHALYQMTTCQWLLVGGLLGVLAMGVYVHTCRRVPPGARRAAHRKVAPAPPVVVPPSTALCLRGFTYGLSPESLDRLYAELVAHLDAHPEIRVLAWDGDLCQAGSFATTIQRLLRDRPTLPCVAFKKDTSVHKLSPLYSETNAYGVTIVTMRGFETAVDGDWTTVAHDAVVRCPWSPSAQLTVVGFPSDVLVAEGRKDYVELSYAGLAWLRRAMGHTHVTVLTMGEGDVVQAEYARLHGGAPDAPELEPRFPETTWVRLEASRSA